MSNAPQIPTEEVKPLELPADSTIPSTETSQPALANEESAEEPNTISQPIANETSTGVATEEPLKEEKKGVEPVTAGVLGYKAPGLLK